MRLLERLITLLFPLRADEALVRDIDELAALSEPHAFELHGVGSMGLLPYRNPSVQACIREAKFRHSQRAVTLLGSVLRDHLLDRIVEDTALGGLVILVPIPLGEQRRKRRGYNQVEEICRSVVSSLDGVSMRTDILVRVKETLPQTELSGAARRENMKDAFSVMLPLNPALSYIVVDDVVTTGATLLAAVTALRAGGAVKVSALALAH